MSHRFARKFSCNTSCGSPCNCNGKCAGCNDKCTTCIDNLKIKCDLCVGRDLCVCRNLFVDCIGAKTDGTILTGPLVTIKDNLAVAGDATVCGSVKTDMIEEKTNNAGVTVKNDLSVCGTLFVDTIAVLNGDYWGCAIRDSGNNHIARLAFDLRGIKHLAAYFVTFTTTASMGAGYRVY